MFDAEHRLIAARFIECAFAGKRGTTLIECVRNKFPEVTWQSIRRAAFLAVTRPNTEARIISEIYDAAVLLQSERSGNV